MERCEVLVVGAGPAGSAAATHLARAGREVILLEASRHPRPKACAEYASPAIPRELGRLEVAPEAWQAAAVPVEGMLVLVDGRSLPIRYADSTGSRNAWGVDRRAFDALLARHAATCGARLLEETRLRALSPTRDGWLATVRGVAGERQIEARWLVGADGARSGVARRLGVERRVGFPRRLGLIAHYEGVSGLVRTGEMHVGGGGYIGLAPTPGGRLNVGMALPLDGASSATRRYEAAIAALPAVGERLAGARRVTPIRGAAPIGHRVADAAGHRWLLVGDAAGFLDPFTGEGIYRALRSARLAADALGEGTPQQVAGAYRSARRRAFAAKDALTWLIQGMLASPPLLAQAVGRLANRREESLLVGSALGDCRPASDALAPAFVLGLLRP